MNTFFGIMCLIASYLYFKDALHPEDVSKRSIRVMSGSLCFILLLFGFMFLTGGKT